MAFKGSDQPKIPSNDDAIPLQNLAYTFEEDEYGYVDTKEKRISMVLFNQLPSRDIGLIDKACTVEELSNQTLRKRYSQYRNLQLKSCSLSSYQNGADVNKIYELLNSDPDTTEENKIKTLREMHHSLTIKRQVKERLDADMKRRRASEVLDRFTRLKLRSNMVWHKVLYEIKNKLYSMEPWHSPIKAIQGRFGSGVASYFIFLRWLLYINFCNFLVSTFFLLTPQLAYEYSNKYPINETSNTSFSPADLITGSGYFSNSVLYFGHYTEEVIELISGTYYNMPLAYLLTIGTNSIINLIAVSYSLTTAYQKNYIDMASDIKHAFCNKVFSAWDYSIETEDAAKLRKIAFCNEIKELLSFIRKEQKDKTMKQKAIQGALMILINIFCFAIIAAVSYVIYFMVDKKTLKVDVRILEDTTLALTVTFVSTAFYFLLKYCTKLEYYLSRKTKLYLTMIRVVLLRTAMLGVIVYFWMVVSHPSRLTDRCYETELGKEIYRLILVNFFAAVVFLTLFGEVIRKFISRHLSATIKLSQFDVAYNTLDLIYYQTLAWLGAFCIPLAPLIIIIILILLFYIKLNSVASNCRPPRRTWSVNEAQTFFLILIFVMYLLTSFTVGYVLFSIPPSNCGPFKQYNMTGELIHNVLFDKGEEHEASEIVKYISSPGVMFAFFCAMCVIVYFTRAQAKAHISVVKKIREQLIMSHSMPNYLVVITLQLPIFLKFTAKEGKDKVFLLKLFDEALTVHTQMNASDNSGKKDTRPKDDFLPTDNSNDLINEGYTDYYDRPLNSPLSRSIEPGYLPANVPINRQNLTGDGTHISPRVDARLRTPLNSPNDGGSPVRKPKGIHIPSHQPGFRQLRGEDSPRTNN